MASKDPNKQSTSRGVTRGPVMYDRSFKESVIALYQAIKEAMVDGVVPSHYDCMTKSLYLFGDKQLRKVVSAKFPRGKDLLMDIISFCVNSAVPENEEMPFKLPAEGKSDVERAFLSLINQRSLAEAGDDSFKDILMGIEIGVVEVYLAVKATIEESTGIKIEIPQKEFEDMVDYVIVHKFSGSNGLARAIAVVYIFTGYFAAKMVRAHPVPSSDSGRFRLFAAIQPPYPFDLFLYMAYRYYMIDSKSYEKRRSTAVAQIMTSQLGKAVILMSYSYSLDITRNCGKALACCSFNMTRHTPCEFITRLVQGSLRNHQTAYRYLVLLSVISELTRSIYNNKKKDNPVEDYVNEAVRIYQRSGMVAFENLLMRTDDCHELAVHVKRLNRAWRDVGNDAIESQAGKSLPVLKTKIFRQLMELVEPFRLREERSSEEPDEDSCSDQESDPKPEEGKLQGHEEEYPTKKTVSPQARFTLRKSPSKKYRRRRVDKGGKSPSKKQPESSSVIEGWWLLLGNRISLSDLPPGQIEVLPGEGVGRVYRPENIETRPNPDGQEAVPSSSGRPQSKGKKPKKSEDKQ